MIIHTFSASDANNATRYNAKAKAKDFGFKTKAKTKIFGLKYNDKAKAEA